MLLHRCGISTFAQQRTAGFIVCAAMGFLRISSVISCPCGCSMPVGIGAGDVRNVLSFFSSLIASKTGLKLFEKADYW